MTRKYIDIPINEIIEGYRDNNNPMMDEGNTEYKYIVISESVNEWRDSGDIPTHIRFYLN